MVRLSPSRRGVALIDAIVGAVVLGISLAAIIGLGGQAARSQAHGEELQVASMLADEQLNLVLARGPDDYAKRFPVRGQCEAPFERFAFELTFSEGSGGAPYRVRATIAWPSGGDSRSLVIEALVAPRPGDDPDPIRYPEAPVERIQ
ncbi:MAG: hypothetical protein JNJ48_06510 [Phycisphaerae bacterium]|nr:hypothetical protein [Phycisphaerae bacterium]